MHTDTEEGDEARGGDTQVTFSTKTGGSLCLVAVAAHYGHAHLLPFLLEAGLSVEGHGSSDQTPLMLAAINGHQRTVEALLDNGADPLAADNAGWTALHWAALFGSAECVSTLTLVTPPCPEVLRAADAHTPMHLASCGGHVGVVKALEEAGWPLFTLDSDGLTPLHWAVKGGCLDVVKYLINKDVQPSTNDSGVHTPLNLAVKEGKDFAKRWLAGKSDAGHMDAARSLQRKVTHSGEVNAAADDGGLSEHGIGDTLNGEELMKLFGFRKFLVDFFLEKALRTAVEEGDEVRVRNLFAMKGGPQVTFQPKSDGSLCMVTEAALHGHDHLLPCLLEAGFSVEGHNSTNLTPLMLAAGHGVERTVEALLNHGADPLATDNAGNTALHHAVSCGQDECASALAASTFLATRDSSSLHGAAGGGSLQMEKPLKEKRVEPFTMKDKNGLTLQDISVMRGSHWMEEWLVKRDIAVHMDAARCLYLMRFQRRTDERIHDQTVSLMAKCKTTVLKFYIPKIVDGHVMDAAGLTPLHCAAERGLSPKCITALLEQGVSPHVLTPDGLTPEDLARRAGHKEALEALRQHQCRQIAASPEDLYEELILFIVSGDDVKAVSSLLCKGVPLEPVGSCSNSALRLAVILDRRRTVSLLLASGAMLPASLLQEAWQSPDVSSGVLATLTNTYLCRLLAERRRLTEHGHKHIIMEGVKLCRVDVLLKGTDLLLMAIKGDAPWKAAWPKDKPQLLSALMAEAVLADCPVMAGFLHRAGAWSFARGEWGSSALSSALEAGHNHMIERLIRHLGGCIYVPDADDRLPRDMLPEAERRHLEQNLFQRERAELKDLKLRQKSESGKKAVRLALKVQEELYASYVAERPQRSLSPADGRSVLQLSVRKGLVQLTYLVVQVGRLHVDEMLDSICGTTALHEAASHGQDSCVELLLGIGAIPLRPDRYGQTPRLLAAMFGHKSTEQLLALREPRDLHCRAGTTAEQASSHYDAYLRSYDRVGRVGRESLTPIDRHDPARVTCKLLGAIGVHELWQKAKEVVVDFSCGEALEVKNVVMKELQTIMDKVAQENSLYRGCLRLVGSSQDQSKIYCPDEFDVNLVITPKNVRVDVKETPKESAKLKGKLQMSVVDDTPGLQGNKFMENLFLLVQKCLTKYTLQDERLSLVPPGLSSTQVGAALALAWQGRKYPLLLVGVDLVPVLELPWHEKIIKPEFLKDKARTFHVSNTADGSWRCSFALTEAMVLKSLAPIKRLVLVMGKVLLSCLKADPWMPQDMKFHCTWFINREWKIVAPSGFCFKNAFLRWLEQLGDEELVAEQEEAHFCAKELIAVFRQLCAEPNVKRGHLTPANISAYFGGDFEGIKPGEGAHLIARCLEENLENEQ